MLRIRKHEMHLNPDSQRLVYMQRIISVTLEEGKFLPIIERYQALLVPILNDKFDAHVSERLYLGCRFMWVQKKTGHNLKPNLWPWGRV